MSKNMKRLISALLAIGMLISSFGAVALAEDSTTTATTTGASEDSYFNEAIGLLKVLKIFEGYEDGSIKPESTITRAEMAAVILRTLDLTQTTAYTNMFTDVDASHWAASTIQVAADAGIINGMGDGTFAPDSPVTYEQAVKMVVCALNYDQLAQGLGGYPTGYITVAARKNIEVTKNATGVVGQEATRGTVAKLIYNALNALYPTSSKLTNDGIEYVTVDGVTLASEKHDVFKAEGMVTATNKTSIHAGSSVAENQTLIDGIIYYNNGIDMNEYVALNVKVYYKEYNSDGVKTIINVIPNSKNVTLKIDAEDIVEDSISNLKQDNATLQYYPNTDSTKTKTVKMKAPTIIYNGKILTSADIPTGTSIEKFIEPDVGDITLYDNDDDGSFDVLFVNKYTTYVVTSATDKAIMGKYNSPAKLSVDTEEDIDVTIVKDGKEVASKNLKKWDVASVLESVNVKGDRIINIQVCNDTITGKISDYDESENGKTYATIDGKEYRVDKAIENEISSGTEGTFYLDIFGRICGVDGTSGSKLSSSEKYGWLIDVRHSVTTDNTTVKMFTQDGKVETYEVASKLDFWGSAVSDTSKTLDFSKDAAGSEQTLMDANVAANAKSAFPIKLIKYALDSNSKIKKLYMSVSAASAKDCAKFDEERVVVNSTNYYKKVGSGNMIDNTYFLEDGMIQFNVPSSVKELNDTSVYKVDSAKASEYINREGVVIDFSLAEFEGNKPGVLIRYVASSSAPSDYDYDSASDNQQIMISNIKKVYDATTEETVYQIKGYANGNEVVLTTTPTTSVSAVKTQPSGTWRNYGATPIWTAASDKTAIINAKNDPNVDFMDILKVGDICGIATDKGKVNTIVKMVYDKGTMCVWGQFSQGSSASRDNIAFGEVLSAEVDSQLMIELSTGSIIAVDPGYYMDVYNVSTGKVEEGKTVSDLIPYDAESKTGDMLYVRQHRVATREIFVIRYE